MNAKLLAVVVSCVAILATQARAAELWEGPAFSAVAKPLAEAVARLPVPEDVSFEILLNNTSFAYDDQGRATTRFHMLYRVLTEPAVRSASMIETTWAPWHQDRPEMRARVITPDGTELKLDPKHVVEVPAEQAGEVLSDRRRIRAPLSGVRVGAIIEREFIVRDTQPFFAQGVSERVEFDSFLPQRLVKLTLEAPAKLPLRYETRGFKLEPKREVNDGRVRLEFVKTEVPRRGLVEPLQLPRVARYPIVVHSTGESWSEIARAYHLLVEKQLAGTDVRALVAGLPKEGESRDQTAARLTARLHELVRYTGLLFGDAAIVPRPPSETLTRRFGDCKDQSALLVAMLRAVGIEAHVALLHSGAVEEIATDLPGLNSFNHAIVHVAGEPPLWIDPTSPLVPIPELPLSDQGKPALVAGPATKGLTRTPRLRSTENQYVQTQEFDLSDPASARVKYAQVARGSIEHEHRQNYSQQTPKALRAEWEDFLKRLYPNGTVAAFAVVDPRDFTKPCRLEAECTGARFGELSAGAVAVSVRPADLLHRLPDFLTHRNLPEHQAEPATGRKTSLGLIENHVAEMIYRFIPPSGFKPTALPEDKERKVGPITLRRAFKIKSDNSVEAHFLLDTGDGLLTPEQADELPLAVEAMGAGKGEPWDFIISFELPALRHSVEGRHREALSLFREQLEKSPDAAGLRTLYAGALLRAGLGEAARSEARRAAEDKPSSANAWHQLGFILTHDELGRHFRPGMDWEGARAAYRRALELQPKHETLGFDYAILLERDERGVRCSTSAKLVDALNEYERLVKLYPLNEQLRLNHLIALLDVGRVDDVKRQAASAPATLAIHGLHLAAIAISDGVEVAKQRAERLEPNAAARLNLLLVAGDNLSRVREYQLATKLWEVGAAGTEREPQVRKLAANLLRTKRHEEHWLMDTEPGAPVQRLYAAVLLEGRELREANRWFLKTTAAALPEEEVSHLTELVRTQFKGLWRDNILPVRRGDALSHLVLAADGEDTHGHRVVARFDNTPARSWYVRKSDGRFQIWIVGPRQGELGVAALKALENNDADGARLYLKWAYDEQRAGIRIFDPYGGTPFARLWGLADAQNLDDLRMAAAALAADSSGSAAAHEELLAARERQASEIRKVQIDRALLVSGARCGKFEASLEAAERIVSGSPGSVEACNAKALMLLLAGKSNEAGKFLRQRLAESPNDAMLKLTLARFASDSGDHVEAEKLWRPLVALRPTAEMLNALAWNALFLNPLPATALEDAKRAVGLEPNPAILHTLATVQAELGQDREAQESLLRAVEARGGRVEDVDHYIRGRLAEHYGLSDAAGTLYEKVQAPDKAEVASTWHLAQKRLQGLKPAPK